MTRRRVLLAAGIGVGAGAVAAALPTRFGIVVAVTLLGALLALALTPPPPAPVTLDRRTLRRLSRPSGKNKARRNRPTPRAAPTPAELTETSSVHLDGLVFDGSDPSVNLMLQSLQPQSFFAGVRTAILGAAEIAVVTQRPLRVLVLDTLTVSREEMLRLVSDLLRAEPRYAALPDGLRLDAPGDRDPTGHHPEDSWVATYWTTAWQLGRLARRGLVDPARVVHLVQDWEPAFHPWGDHHLMVRSVYDHGFTLVVNSRSLAAYVEQETGRVPDPRLVFAPELDPAPLHDAALAWKPDPDGLLRVLFYARPSKPRNLYPLGLQALRLWADTLPDGQQVTVRLAGEEVQDVDLGPRLRVERRGKLDYADYYRLLAETDLGLALMCSPHPGHLALELPAAGIPTVTNPFEGFRTPWVDGLQVAERPAADSVAAALARAAERAAAQTAHHPVDPSTSDLGGSLQEAMGRAAALLRQR